ncbi:NAD(P)-dependent oxidoreductase [Kitasatospora sp. MMS16-BH015]|uniref:NAD(P)H-binding protein n=1 Tax=Kitasatospora sp. MMS16-BH015 TaxID=2018025 RepID=UPI000CA263EC|nr:NAD(P)H-binding protein [Kitasatospora sp. MMS16-BH015]AUG75228.1 NAD(P)-dependent oxidoreductase [Kitasatospora sp. MMS16-BH015]
MSSAPDSPTGPGAVLVIGATGTTGRRTVARLAAAGHRVKAAGRSATPLAGAEAVHFDWFDPTTHDGALTGADRVYLVPPVGEPDPARVMLPFLRRARASGVHRAVLLSSSAVPAGGPAVGQVHQALPELFDQWAVLRPSWFMQNFTSDHLHAEEIRTTGAFRTAAGAGRVGFVDAEDIAAVAVHALIDDHAPDRDLILTGPEALDHDEVAAVLSAVTGRRVAHHRLTYREQRDRLAALMPAEFATLLAQMDLAIAAGAEDRTTDTVRLLTGRPPHDFRQVAVRELNRDR